MQLTRGMHAQEWLEEQRSAPMPAQTPVLPEYHLQLPASAFEPFSATGSGVSTPTPMEEDPQACASPGAEPAPRRDQQAANTLTEYTMFPADNLARRVIARSASSIKPRVSHAQRPAQPPSCNTVAHQQQQRTSARHQSLSCPPPPSLLILPCVTL